MIKSMTGFGAGDAETADFRSCADGYAVSHFV